MLKNYLKIAFRNLFKNKTYSAINIFGLSIGVACCLLILLYLTNEFSYDRFHEHSDRIYRTWVHEDYGDGDIYWNTVTPLVLKPTLEENIPEVESVARRYVYNDQVKISDQAESFSEPIQLIDPEFFTIFNFQILEGDPQSVFNQPSSVVLTPSSAKRFFGTADVLQKTLLIKVNDQFEPFTVTGIVEEAPANSSITYQLLIPFENGRKLFNDRAYQTWFSVVPETYVLLAEGSDIEDTRAKLTPMMQQALGERWQQSKYQVGLQPISDIHLNPEIPVGIAPVSDPSYLYILAGIALLVLLIACVNFMTLSISRSTSRAREVGIRKTIGAERTHLMYQFWGEALLMTILALGAGLFLTEILLPYFNNLSGTNLHLTSSIQTALLFTGLTVFISLVSGIYPALILSGFKPVEVLKGKIKVRGDKSLFRTGMVVFQFTLSIFLIGSTFIINDQLDYMRSKDLGYQKEQIVVLQIDDNPSQETGFTGMMEEARNRTKLLESQLASTPEIQGISVSLQTPADAGWMTVDYRDTDDKKHTFNVNLVDARYPEVMNFKFTDGRSFSEAIASDERQAIIVNQAFVNEHGWKEPLAEKFPSPDFRDHEIVGVVEDFNYASLHTQVEPLAMVINPMIIFSGIDNIDINSSSPKISVKIDSKNIPATMHQLRSVWEKISPDEPFNYNFLDQAVDSQYRQEERLSQIVLFGSAFAVTIACMGLFGLASLMVVRRTKEIGVRKVLGASSKRIVVLINREFTLLLIIAFVLAAPATWFAMNTWLQDFAYGVDINISTLLLAGAITILVAWLTVGYQSFKATTINPVDSLRGE